MPRRICLGLSLVACTANPSRLEEISERQMAAQAELPPEQEAIAMPPAPPLTAMSPTVDTPAPPGIDAALWRDIGWFPGDTIEVSGFVGHDNQMMVRWFEQAIVAEFPACAPLAAAVERTYMVLQDGAQHSATVFFGTMTREQERACMRVVLPGLGLTGTQHEALTILSYEQTLSARAAWFSRPGGAVVVLEGDAPLERWMPPNPGLRPELLTLIGEVDRSPGVWSVGLRPFGWIITGVESTGYTLAAAMPRATQQSVLSARLGLRFASPREAERAETGAVKFIAEAPSAEGTGLSFSHRTDGAWLRFEVNADSSTTNLEAVLAWGARVMAELQARAEQLSPEP